MARPKMIVSPVNMDNPSFREPDGKVELGTDYTPVGPDREEILQRIIKPKHPEMHFAWPSKEHARFKHLGWKMLTFTDGGQDVAEVATADEAERTTDNVLCWRPMELQRKFTQKEDNERIRINRMVRGESTHTQAAAVNSMIGGTGVKASALKETD